VTVTVERDQIVIRRAGADGSPETSGADDGDGEAAAGEDGGDAGLDPDAFDA
jgi:hypothetical protein